MSENTLHVKKHTCPTCGGQLKVDLSRQMYECPFCGVTFDYAYFNEDDVILRATRSLLAGEFHSAGEAYDFMLTKDPHNFSALRGKILASAAVMNLSQLDMVEKLVRMDNGAVDASMQRALSDCHPEHNPYFSKMNEILETGKEYKEEQNQLRALRKERSQTLQKVHCLEEEKNEIGVKVRDPDDPFDTTIMEPKPILFLSLIAYVLLVLFVLAAFIWLPNAPGATSTTTRKTSSSYYIRKTTAKTQSKTTVKPAVPGQETDLSEVDTDVVAFMMDQVMSSDDESTRLQEELQKELDIIKREEEKKQKEKNKETRDTARNIIIVLTLLEGGIATVLILQIKKQSEYDHSISSVLQTANGLKNQITSHVEKSGQLKRKIHMLYREMEKLDPEPDTSLRAASSNGMRKRWM